MKKQIFSLSLVFVFCLVTAFMLSACDSANPSDNGGDDNGNETGTEVLLSDYTLPVNFAMTIQISDTAISNAGSPWYYKTAKIGNDWQIIEYNRDLADMTQQVTHFFQYIGEDDYVHYTYNYTTSSWDEGTHMSFDDMVDLSENNFWFLYSKDLSNENVTETNLSYDTDSTSNEHLIDAVKYEYSNVLQYEEVVDADVHNVLLSETIRNGSTVLISNRAYDYTTSILSWENSYLSFKNYKTAPY